MLKKGAIELSMNFLVIIIISVVIFGYGVYFITSLSSKANDWTKMSTEELDKQIGDLVCQGFERVCITAGKKTIQKLNFDVFGIKVFNIYGPQTFSVEVTNTNMIAPGGTDIIPASPQLNINPPDRRSVLIDKNEGKSVGVGVQVPPDAVAGTYILDVTISDQLNNEYVPIQKLYVDVP